MSHPSNKYGLTYAHFMVYMRSSVHVLALYKILHLVSFRYFAQAPYNDFKLISLYFAKEFRSVQ